MGGTNLLVALGWALAQPLHHSYPRQLFLFTDAAAGNTGRILRLLRRQASTVRYGTGAMRGSRCSPCALDRSHHFFLLQPQISSAPTPRVFFTHHIPQPHWLGFPWGAPSQQAARVAPLAIKHPCPGPGTSVAVAFHCPALLQVLQLRHGPTGVPAAAEGHGQGQQGPCRVPEPS